MGTVRGYESGGDQDGFSVDESAFIGAAASELSAPLVLLRQLSLALTDESLNPQERRRLTEQVALTSERALRLTRHLSFHPDMQPLIELEPVNAVTLCREVAHELTPLFRAHDRSITVRQRTKAPLLIADRKLLRQVLVSFGDSALHYGSHEQPVQLTIAATGQSVRVGVRDYGPSVPSDVWQRLEGRVARRATVPLPRRPYTSGVGLMAARRLTELMGGEIGVTRHRDGATFYVDMHVSGQMSLL